MSLSSCIPDVSHFFLALIASFTSSFDRYVTLSPVGLLPIDIPITSCPALNITKPISSHNFWTLSNSLLSPNSFSLNCILRLSSVSLHHLIFGVTCPGLLRAVGWTAAVLVLLQFVVDSTQYTIQTQYLPRCLSIWAVIRIGPLLPVWKSFWQGIECIAL